MPKSPAYQRIRAAVLAVAQAIPAGRVTSFRAVGAHLDVEPRHVAYILATLPDDEKAAVPWHRVVSDGGALDRPKHDGDGRSQADLLAAEGLTVGADLRLKEFDERFFEVTEESTGVGPVARDPSAPAPRRRRS